MTFYVAARRLHTYSVKIPPRDSDTTAKTVSFVCSEVLHYFSTQLAAFCHAWFSCWARRWGPSFQRRDGTWRVALLLPSQVLFLCRIISVEVRAMAGHISRYQRSGYPSMYGGVQCFQHRKMVVHREVCGLHGAWHSDCANAVAV